LLEKITADVTARLAEVMIEKFTSDSKDNPLLEIIYAKLHGEILPQVVETVDSQVAALQTEIHSTISITFKEETDLCVRKCDLVADSLRAQLSSLREELTGGRVPPELAFEAHHHPIDGNTTDEQKKKKKKSQKEDRHDRRTSHRPSSDEETSGEDFSESDSGSDLDKYRRPSLNHPRGRAVKGLTELKPLNENFSKVLSYRSYRLEIRVRSTTLVFPRR
jgi:hypothetical protein